MMATNGRENYFRARLTGSRLSGSILRPVRIRELHMNVTLSSMLRTAGLLLAFFASSSSWSQPHEHAVSNEKFPDPTSGPIVLLPGPLDVPQATDEHKMSSALGWHLPGRNFRSGDGWWALACEKTCT